MNRGARQGGGTDAGVAPLRVDFLPSEALGTPGRLGLTMAPGRRDQEPRDLVADLRLLRAGHGVDLLVTPAVAVPAFDARPAGSVPLTPQNMLGWTPFSYPFNLTQQPACTIPCGLTRDGLPIGLQIVGPMFGDALVLRAARAYETLRPIPRPALDF